MNAAEWAERLGERFSALRHERPPAAPLFAIEHGLSLEEVKDLRNALVVALDSGRPRPEHWLPWVVSATECGYVYSGQDYWGPFAATTPGWRDGNTSRNQLRRFFDRFAEQFGGVKPEGEWAGDFNIIARPITNAIAPQDLQGALLGAFDAFLRQGRPLGTSTEIGAGVEAAAPAGSRRFRQFLRQHTIIGHFLLGLKRLHTETAGDLDVATLRRICRDLGSAEEGRQRQLARVIGGLKASGSRQAAPGRRGRPEAPAPAGDKRVAPRLKVTPSANHGVDWALWMCIPSLQGLAVEDRRLDAALRARAARIEGARKEDPVDPGALLRVETLVPLRHWPQPGKPIIALVRADQDVNAALSARVVDREIPRLDQPVIFSIGEAGEGWPSGGKTLRRGARYLVATAGPLPPGARPVRCSTEGVQWGEVEIPRDATPEEHALAEALGRPLRPSVSVTPSGLPAVGEDDDGWTTWIEGESPAFAICSDHDLFAAKVSGAGGLLDLGDLPRGERRIFQVEGLPAGRHLLALTYRLAPSQQDSSATLGLEVRGRGDLGAPSDLEGALQVRVTPPGASLEALWSGEVTLDVLAPAGTKVKVTIALHHVFEEGGATESFSALAPLLGRDLIREFERTTKNKLVDHYGWASSATVTIRTVGDGAPSAIASCEFEREGDALRWVPQRRGRNAPWTAKLVDDTGEDGGVALFHACLDTPWRFDRREGADEGAATAGPAFGLFGAVKASHQAWLVIEPTLPIPVSMVVPEDVGLSALLDAAARWRGAAIAGTGDQGRAIANSLHDEVLRRCGAEAGLRSEFAAVLGDRTRPIEDAAPAAKALILKGSADVISHAFAKDVEKITKKESDDASEAVAFGQACIAYVRGLRLAAFLAQLDAASGPPARGKLTLGGGSMGWFALALAKDPRRAIQAAGDRIEDLAAALRRAPLIMRGALALAVAGARVLGSDPLSTDGDRP